MLNDTMMVTPESPLFIKNKNFCKYLHSKNEFDRALTSYSICRDIYTPISKRIEGPIKSGTYRLIRSHNMRKFFSTTLMNAGVDGDVIEHFMGHTLGVVKQAYVKFDTEFLKNVYMKNYLALLIDERTDASTSPEFKALKENNEELSNQNDASRSLAYQYKGRAAELEEENNELSKSCETQSTLINTLMSNPSIRDLMSKLMEQTEEKKEENENEEEGDE